MEHKISEEKRLELLSMQEKISIADAELQYERASLHLTLAKIMAKLGAPAASSALCLECGTVRNNTAPHCPGCQSA